MAEPKPTKARRRRRKRTLTSEAAAALANKKWAAITPEARREALAAVQAKRDMSPEARLAIGKRLAEARAHRKKCGVDYRTRMGIRLGKYRVPVEEPKVKRKKSSVK